ncbi:MAG: hypothetical protein HAW58_06085, partial [Candidatus Thioglobus sp.]|nr:hypothetical protein [Candidatus Thioglobus sp.]
RPLPAATSINETSFPLVLNGSAKIYFLVTAVHPGGIESFTSPVQASAIGQEFAFATVAGNQNSVWMDRNLGAIREATSADDADGFGGYYQWGRATDQHQLRNSITRSTQENNITPSHSQFITGFDDWVATVDDDGSQRQEFWGKIDGLGICPAGFKVPTIENFRTENSDNWNNSTAFASNLKLPNAGFRANTGTLNTSESANYWMIDGQNLQIGMSGSSVVNASKAQGSQVRCIRESSITIADVPVSVKVAEITITSENEITKNASFPLTATASPANASNKDIIWSVKSGDNFASINNSNIVRGIGEGVAVLVATAADGSGIFTEQVFRVLPPAPGIMRAAPSALTVVATGVANQVELSWPVVSGATNYRIYQSANDLESSQGNPAPMADFEELIDNKLIMDLGAAKAKHYFLVTTIDNEVESLTNSKQAVAVPHDFVFKTVVSADNRVWMDRNLGAQRVPLDSNIQIIERGHYFQWGRWADRHASDIDGPRSIVIGSNEFGAKINQLEYQDLRGIEINGVNNSDGFVGNEKADWLSVGVDNNGARRQAFWSRIDGSSICPTGFRVPSKEEWNTEFISWISGAAGGFSSNLKIPSSGFLKENSTFIGVNKQAKLWSSTPGIKEGGQQAVHFMVVSGKTKLALNDHRGRGHSVRCIKN